MLDPSTLCRLLQEAGPDLLFVEEQLVFPKLQLAPGIFDRQGEHFLAQSEVAFGHIAVQFRVVGQFVKLEL